MEHNAECKKHAQKLNIFLQIKTDNKQVNTLIYTNNTNCLVGNSKGALEDNDGLERESYTQANFPWKTGI